jgi:hypothetical protein
VTRNDDDDDDNNNNVNNNNNNNNNNKRGILQAGYTTFKMLPATASSPMASLISPDLRHRYNNDTIIQRNQT